ncbi:unnamed protein product, partial [Symbiodinium sp. CCMP2456]
GAILKGSSRERLCNSVQPGAVLEEMEKKHIDPVPKTEQDAVLVGMSLKEAKPHQITSWLEAASGPPPAQCDQQTGVQYCKNPVMHKNFLEHCEKLNEGWQFLESAKHSKLRTHADAVETIDVSDCGNKLSQPDVDSVSWLGSQTACYIIKTREEHKVAVLDAYKAVKKKVSDLPKGVRDTALFKRK